MKLCWWLPLCWFVIACGDSSSGDDVAPDAGIDAHVGRPDGVALCSSPPADADPATTGFWTALAARRAWLRWTVYYLLAMGALGLTAMRMASMPLQPQQFIYFQF